MLPQPVGLAGVGPQERRLVDRMAEAVTEEDQGGLPGGVDAGLVGLDHGRVSGKWALTAMATFSSQHGSLRMSRRPIPQSERALYQVLLDRAVTPARRDLPVHPAPSNGRRHSVDRGEDSESLAVLQVPEVPGVPLSTEATSNGPRPQLVVVSTATTAS